MQKITNHKTNSDSFFVKIIADRVSALAFIGTWYLEGINDLSPVIEGDVVHTHE